MKINKEIENRNKLYNNLAKIIHKDDDLIAERITFGSPVLIHRTLVFPVMNIICNDGFINLKNLRNQWHLEVYYSSHNRSFYLCYKEKVINVIESITTHRDLVNRILCSFVPFDLEFRALQLTLLALYKDRYYYINTKKYRKETNKFIQEKDSRDLEIYLENIVKDVRITTPCGDLLCEKCHINLKNEVCLRLRDIFYQTMFYCKTCGEPLRKIINSQRCVPKIKPQSNYICTDEGRLDIDKLFDFTKK